MPMHSFEYAIIRVVPRVEREEFLNVGVLLWCPMVDFLQVKIELNRKRLEDFCPLADVDTIQSHLDIIPLICAGGESGGPIGKLSQRERFHWLVAPRSSLIQFSPVHSGLCETPAASLQRIFERTVL